MDRTPLSTRFFSVDIQQQLCLQSNFKACTKLNNSAGVKSRAVNIKLTVCRRFYCNEGAIKFSEFSCQKLHPICETLQQYVKPNYCRTVLRARTRLLIELVLLLIEYKLFEKL